MLFLFILLSSLLLQFFLPWWIIAPVAFALAAWKAENGSHAFKSGFGAVFLLWILMSLLQTLPNDNILANRIGQLFMLPEWSFNWIIMLLITGIIGGLVSGIAALSGFYCRHAFIK